MSSEALHPVIAQKYGSVRAVTVHCTDVVGDAGALARATAYSSARQSSYHLLIARDGLLYQLAPIHWILWHAGRSLRNGKGTGYLDVWEDAPQHRREVEKVVRISSAPAAAVAGSRAARGTAKGAWKWPVVDGVEVGNPNNWAIGCEVQGKPGRPTPEQEDTLVQILRELYAKTHVTPDTVWPHGRNSGAPGLDPLNRSDPGFDVPAFAVAAQRAAERPAPETVEEREADGWDASGDDETEAHADPTSPARGPGQHP